MLASDRVAMAVAQVLVRKPQPDAAALMKLAGNVGNRLNAVGMGPAWRQQQGLKSVMEVLGAALLEAFGAELQGAQSPQ